MTFVENQREAKDALLTLSSRKEQVILIHYSCESFYHIKDGRTPRITSIACRNFGNAQTRSFSIHQISELPEFKDVVAWEAFDDIEKVLLDRFFQYVNTHVNYAKWVHWNMRDIMYGFHAIEHRYEVLDGCPVVIPDEKKYDLSRIFISRYGNHYADHPRLEHIMKINNITNKDFLSGENEAVAFNSQKFFELHQSTLRKVHVMSTLLRESISGRLKTKAKLWDLYGGSLRLILEKYVWTPVGKILAVLAIILSLIGWIYPDAQAFVGEWVKDFMSEK